MKRAPLDGLIVRFQSKCLLSNLANSANENDIEMRCKTSDISFGPVIFHVWSGHLKHGL
jgi:hypothetical protein